MEKIEKLNEILRKNISLDIFNNKVLQENELTQKVSKKIDKYYYFKISLEDIIKSIYGKDAQIVIKENIISETPSNIQNIDIKNADPKRVLNLSDLGHKTIQINYYVKKNNDNTLIYIGTNKGNVIKYNEVLTEIGFMNKLEQQFNIRLNPNIEHVDVINGKRLIYIDEYGDVKPNYVYETVIDTVKNNKAIKTVEDVIIAEDIDCTNFDGYSSEDFRPYKVQLDFDLKENNLLCDLRNIPCEILNEFKKNARKNIYNNYIDIIKDVIEVIKEYINDNTENLNNKFFTALYSIYYVYPSIIDYCLEAAIITPKINNIDFRNFNNDMIGLNKKLRINHKHDIEKLEKDLQNINNEKNTCIDELEKILKTSNNYWNNFHTHPTNVIGLDEAGDYIIRVDTYIEDLYCDFCSFIEDSPESTEEPVEKIKNYIEGVKEEIEYGRSFEKIFFDDFYFLKEEELPFDDAERLVVFIEENLEYVKNLINEINRLEKNEDRLENELYLVKENFENKNNIYSNLIHKSDSIDDDFNTLLCSSEYLSEFCIFLEELASIISLDIKKSEEYKKLCFYIELFNSVINGNIFDNSLNEKNKYHDFLDSRKPKYSDDNYVEIIKKQIKSIKHKK